MSQLLHEFACAILIDTQGRFLLQQRDNVSKIRYPGRVSLFGGHREGGESFLQCAVREINEEISYYVAPGRFQYLMTYDGTIQSEGAPTRGAIFVAEGIPVDSLVVTEGSLLIVPQAEVAKIEHKLTPSAGFALTSFLGDEAKRRGRDEKGR
jgi:8-oxo-dGTP pyrophosphatase MutT (NUDIX family)